VRQQSAHSFSALHSMQGAGKGNLRSNYESTYGLCARRIRGSASSVKCCRTVTVTLYRYEIVPLSGGYAGRKVFDKPCRMWAQVTGSWSGVFQIPSDLVVG